MMDLPFYDTDCGGCRYEHQSGNAYPCCNCKRLYHDHWTARTNLTEIKDSGDAEEDADAIIDFLAHVDAKTDLERMGALMEWLNKEVL